MALCVTHNISFDPQWEWCIYCGKPKTAELAVGENTSTNTASAKPWVCERCGAEYAEYVNGCPRCATGEAGGSASVR